LINGVNSEHRLTLLDRVTAWTGYWLCQLLHDDEAFRVAVGIRLALKLCVPHQCRCVSEVDSFGRHSLVCKRAPSRTARQHHLNDVIARFLALAGVPVSKEPSGLSRSDGKRPEFYFFNPRNSTIPVDEDILAHHACMCQNILVNR